MWHQLWKRLRYKSNREYRVVDKQAGVSHHRAGRLGEAEGMYRQVLKVQTPNHPGALHLLGAIAHQTKR